MMSATGGDMLKQKFSISLHLAELIDEISSLRERIIRSPIQIAWIPALQKETLIKNAMGSTAIEGFVLSLPEVRGLAEGSKISRSFSVAEKAVLNYLACLRYIQKHKKEKSFTHEKILKLHRITGEGAVEQGPAGSYRTIQNYVVNGIGNVVYTPPPPAKVRPDMTELLDWINKESNAQLPVISSGIIHYHFVRIHPFVDGNGRVARILGTWELLRRNFDTLHILAIDDLIYEHKRNYYAALGSVSENGGDMTKWLEFYLEIVAESLDLAWKRIASLPKTKKDVDLVLTPKQEKLLSLFRDAGNLSAKEIAKALKVTVQGAHFILTPLLKAKIVKRYGGRKTGKYGLSR